MRRKKHIRLNAAKKTHSVERGEKNTFGDQVHDIFKDLPKTIRIIKDRTVLIREAKRYY